MATYRIPAFPLPVGIWRSTNPTTNPPTILTVGNLAWGGRVNAPSIGFNVSGSTPVVLAQMVLLLPKGTDIRPRNLLTPTTSDIVEVPRSSGRFYSVEFVDDIGKGFSNEHRAAWIFALAPWPMPIP